MSDQVLVAVSRKRREGEGHALLAIILLLCAGTAQAAPVGGQIASGSGAISQAGAETTVTQSGPALSLNWKSFNIGSQETVTFVQPSTAAVAVNRISDPNGTQILGHLNANGQVYLINPNGILFGQDAQVNVGGLVASTLDLNDASLNGDERSFSGNGSGSVVNRGTINAAHGGSVALLGNHVNNQGVITAQLGAIALGAGNAVTITFSGNSLVHIQVDQSVLNSLAENGGLIRADGGMVVMTAGAKQALLASAVNNTGVIEARTVQNHDGIITLLGGMMAGTVNAGGTLDASAPNGGDGGAIETSAARVTVANDTKVTTAAPNGRYGTWLVDPQDYTVAASGGDITGATLSANLATTAVTLQSSRGGAVGSGNVNIYDPVTWSANTTLTLTASNNVNVHANITATGNTAGLIINPNTANGTEAGSGTGVFSLNSASVTLSGTNPSLSIAGTPYIVINNLGAAQDATATPATPTLQGTASASLAGHYALGSNINATATLAWNANTGFTPIGSVAFPFTGTFDGLSHTISGLTINVPANADVGLFGSTGTTSIIQNLGLIGGSVVGLSSAGGLVGSNTGAIVNSYNTGTVSGGSSLGGLMGSNTGTVSYSYATGNVSGTSSLGGLMGSSTGPVSYSYATGNVTGTSSLGGLMGSSTSTVSNSYATGNVAGTSSVGGLMGSSTGIVTDTYATGSVTGTTSVGGLMGSSTNTVNDSYWNTETSGQTTSPGGTGLTTAQMLQAGNFHLWDFANTWTIFNGVTDPLLGSLMVPLMVTANNATKTYDGQAYSGGNGVTYSSPPDSNLLGTVTYSGTSQGATNAGGYVITPGGLYSNQQYIISYGNGTLTVAAAPLTVTATAQSRIYGATNPALTYVSTGLVNGDTLSGLLATTATTTSNVGSYGITQGTLAASSNYALTYNAANLAVTAAPLTVAADALSRTYGAANPALTYVSAGLINGDTLSGLLATTATTTSNVGSYGITQGTLAASSNYALAYNAANLAITAAALTVTANAQSRIYGAPNPALTYVSTGLVNGDSISGLFATTATTTSNVGSYGISQGTLAASSNYALTYNAANLAVTAAALIVTADAQSRIYGAANPTLTYVSAGLVNGDTLSGLLATPATTTSNVGAYGITQGTLAASCNYALAYNAANLAVTAAALTVTADAQSRIYGAANPALTYVSAGLVNGDTLSGLLATTTTTTSNVGSYGISQGTLAASSNYALAYNAANLAVTAAALSVTADAQSRIYGAANPALTYVSAGLVNGDTLSGLLATTANTASNVGAYGITQGTLAASSNYALAYNAADLAVTTAPLTVTANVQSRVYGATNPTLTYVSTGLVNGDTLSGLLATTANTVSNVGSYGITQGTLTASSNYALTYNAANLAVTASPLIVTADAQSRIYGAANPALTYVSSGLVNGDTLSGLLATVATTTSNVGSYGISQGTLAASSNYALAYNAANLAVTTAPLTVTAAALTVTTANVTPQPILPVVPSINVVTNIVTASLPAPPIPDTTLQEPTLAAIQPIPVVTDTEAVSLIRPPVLNVRKQFESIVCHPKQAYDQRRLICSQPYGFSSDAVAASDTSAPGTGKRAALTIAMRIGNVRTPLRIVDGGMRLPGNIVR